MRSTILIYCKEETHKMIRAEAERKGMSISAYMVHCFTATCRHEGTCPECGKELEVGPGPEAQG